VVINAGTDSDMRQLDPETVLAGIPSSNNHYVTSGVEASGIPNQRELYRGCLQLSTDAKSAKAVPFRESRKLPKTKSDRSTSAGIRAGYLYSLYLTDSGANKSA